MKQIAVIYKSKYGTTKQYATWIAEELKADLFNRSRINPKELSGYDLVVYGGGLYAGGISGIDLVTRNPCKNLVIFTVGLADPNTTDYSDIIRKNIPEEKFKDIKIFHLRGGIDYKKLGIVHKSMMAMLKKVMLDKKAEYERTEDDRMMTETYGKKVDFTDRKTIRPIVEYVRSFDN